MRALHLAFLMFLLACTTGCAFAPVAKVNYDSYFSQFPRERTVPLPAKEVFVAARKALGAMGYEMQAETPELGTMLTKVIQVPIPTTCDCGSWNFNPVTGTADSQIKVILYPAADSTRIVIDHGCGTRFTGQNLYGATTVNEVYRCASRGLVERDFWDKFDRLLAVGAGVVH